MTVLTKEIQNPLTKELSEAGTFVPLMELDCKGLVPLKIEFGRGWKAESVSFLSPPCFAPFMICRIIDQIMMCSVCHPCVDWWG